METNLPTPMTGRVYVNLLEGTLQLFNSSPWEIWPIEIDGLPN
jgi:hypothetical protein